MLRAPPGFIFSCAVLFAKYNNLIYKSVLLIYHKLFPQINRFIHKFVNNSKLSLLIIFRNVGNLG